MSRSAVVALGKLIGFVGINSKACHGAGPIALGGTRAAGGHGGEETARTPVKMAGVGRQRQRRQWRRRRWEGGDSSSGDSDDDGDGRTTVTMHGGIRRGTVTWQA